MTTRRLPGTTVLDNINATASAIGSVSVATTVGGATASTATGLTLRTLRIPITHSKTTAEQRTSVNLPAKSFVYDVFANITTAEATGATKTIDIGTYSASGGGDADGFADALSVAATGLIRPQAAITVGTETYFSSNTRGILLSNYMAGADALTDHGLYQEKPYASDSETQKEITWTMGSNDFEELVGEIVIIYAEV